MFYSQQVRQPSSHKFMAAVLPQLRRQPPKAAIAAPPSRAAPQPAWPARAASRLKRQVVVVSLFAAAALALAAVFPAWAATQHHDRPSVRSSVDVTGDAATRLDDLSATALVSRIPFLQQSRYLGSTGADRVSPKSFVTGARESRVADYIETVGIQMAMPYLNNAAAINEAIELWTATAIRAEREAASLQAQAPAPAPAPAQAPFEPAWRPPATAGGTVIPGATITFYSCIGSGFCGLMATGQQCFNGAAACSYNMPFGTRFIVNRDPTGRVFTCLDRGLLGPSWVDIWFYDPADGWAWQRLIGGTYSDITIVA